MDIESLRSYCLKKKGKITEEFPFDEETLVFKVNGKVFLLMNINERPLSVNLKCEPGLALELRERYDAVQPGYHMNKKHWNTVTIDGSIPPGEVWRMIDLSYEAVVGGLKKADRDILLKGLKRSARSITRSTK